MFRNFFFCCVLRSNRTLWHVDVVVHFERRYVKKKKKNVSRAGNTQKTHGLHSHLKICTFLHFSSSTLFLVYFSVFLITFYNFPSSFSCCWEKKIVFFPISFACCARARVFALKGRVSVFFKICACNFSRRVCHYSKHTLSHPHTHHMDRKMERNTLKLYIHYIFVYLFSHFFLNRFIIISMMNYKRWPPFIETRVFWVCLFISPFP